SCEERPGITQPPATELIRQGREQQRRMIMKVRCFAIIAALACIACAPALAQDTSRRPIRLLVPSPPGGPSDFAARLIVPRLSEALGRNVIVDNRQSVNGIVASEIAAKSP